MPDAYAQFGPGPRQKGVSGSYNVAWGTTPGVCRLSVGRGFGQIGQVANLKIYFRDRHITLRDALAVDPNVSSGTTTVPLFNFSVLDRRWKWKHAGRIYGSYNVVRQNQQLERQKNPQELARLLFDALGEQNADVTALPTDPRPLIAWAAASPRDALDSLAADYGCVVAFDPIDDKARLVKIGQGLAPNFTASGIISRSESLPTPQIPKAFRLVTGPVLVQTALKLGEAVGREVDGKWLPIDQLSYTPPGGWSQIDPWDFKQLTSEYVDPATGDTVYHRNLAEAYIWRSYRITGQAGDGGFFGFGVSPQVFKGTAVEPQTIRDIGPFLGSLLDRDPSSGDRLPMYARGVYADERLGYENSKPNSRFPGTVSIDQENRIATFAQPLFQYNANQQPIPAAVALLAAYACTYQGTQIRYERFRDTGGNQQANRAGEEISVHDEIVREIVEANASATGVASDNLARVDQQANYYIDAMASKYTEAPAASITFGGLKTFRCDGAIRSIVWSWSIRDTPKTVVSWNCERSPGIIPWEQRSPARLQKQADYAVRQIAAIREVDASRKAAKVAT